MCWSSRQREVTLLHHSGSNSLLSGFRELSNCIYYSESESEIESESESPGRGRLLYSTTVGLTHYSPVLGN